MSVSCLDIALLAIGGVVGWFIPDVIKWLLDRFMKGGA
tara:strand:- start:124 stop:237 length:114 start_codon:yes stop_codon:yes gene_type:complete